MLDSIYPPPIPGSDRQVDAGCGGEDPSAVSRLKSEVTHLSIHCHPEAAAAAPRMSMLAQTKRRGGGRRRTPQLQAGKGGWIPLVCDARPPPFPASRLGVLRGSLLRRLI